MIFTRRVDRYPIKIYIPQYSHRVTKVGRLEETMTDYY